MGGNPTNGITDASSKTPTEAPWRSVDHRVYRAIVNTIPDMIIRISRDGVRKSFEGATSELYWPADTYIGKHLQDVLPSDTAALFLTKKPWLSSATFPIKKGPKQCKRHFHQSRFAAGTRAQHRFFD